MVRPKEDDRGNLYLCPECDTENPGWVQLLHFLYRFPTDWYGTLRYYQCPTCHSQFVLRDQKDAIPELATIR